MYDPLNGMPTAFIPTKKLTPEAKMPFYASPGAAGADLFSTEYAIIRGGASRLIKTGLAIKLPPGLEAQIRPRSGLALKHNITVLNTPGTIDSDYRGDIGVILMNHGDAPFIVNVHDRIAQMVIAPVWRGGFIPAEDLPDTIRSSGAFGSTGTK